MILIEITEFRTTVIDRGTLIGHFKAVDIEVWYSNNNKHFYTVEWFSQYTVDARVILKIFMEKKRISVYFMEDDVG